MTEMQNAHPLVTVKPIEPKTYQHASSDKKPPTRYAVYVNGVNIGEVGSLSEESWDLSRNGRIRTRMRGYARSWRGDLAQGASNSFRRGDAWHSTRAGCIEILVARYLEKR